MTEQKQEKAIYVVVTPFAHFQEGEEVSLTVPPPTAAEAHVKLKADGKKKRDTAEVKALKAKVAELEAQIAEAAKKPDDKK